MKTTTTKFKLSQSCLKELEKKDSCHYYWQKKWINKEVVEQSTIPMQRGHYFEQMAIGGNSDYGDAVIDLPRLKDGKKGAEQQRLDEQVVYFKSWFKDMGFTILPETVQLKLETEDFTGTVDFMAQGPDGEIGIWDIKTTADIYSEFGYTAWSKPETVDFTQQYAYARAWYLMTGQLLRCYMYVLDYSTSKNVKVFEVKFDPTKRFEEIEQRLKWAYEYIEPFMEEGIDLPPNPSLRNCVKCALVHKCQFAIKKPLIEVIELD